MKFLEFRSGLRDGIPICIGYFAVSFGFGALVAGYGFSILDGALISITNLTSAGQFAGLTVMAASGTMLDVVLTQIVINSRYALMSLALGQRLGREFGTGKRLVVAHFVTDEIFALAMERTKPLIMEYLMGLVALPVAGWVSGTVLGAAASNALPLSVRTALGVALYGMFVAVVAPQARRKKPFLAAAGLAAALSCAVEWLPVFANLSAGLGIVLCTVVTAAVCAVLFPVEEKKEAEV